jgi:hypothetical protein
MSTPEDPGTQRSIGISPVMPARLPIPGNAEFAVFFLVRHFGFARNAD